MSKIETKWLPVCHFTSTKYVICCPCVSLDTLFNIHALAFMQGIRDIEKNK